MKKFNYKDCAELLLSHDSFLILTHKNPDGDTVGSACALCSALRRAGKNAFLYPNPQITEKLLPYAERYFAPADFVPEYTVAVDIASEGLFPEGYSGNAELCIDHHPTNTHYAPQFLVRSERASCGEAVYEIVKRMLGGITQEEADLLYIAVSTDTGCFQYTNTTSETFRTASELMAHGANNAEINKVFFRKVSRERLRLEGMIYSSLRYFREGKIAVAVITREMIESSGAPESDLDDLAGLPGRSEGSLLNVTLREKDNGYCRVSLRSSKGVSSSDICAVFGGGGHGMAAGCNIMGTPEQALEILLAVIDEVWK